MTQRTKTRNQPKVKMRSKQSAITTIPNNTIAAIPNSIPPVPEQSHHADIPPPPSNGFEQLLETAAKEILAVTYWFEPAPGPQPYPVTIEFSGQRIDGTEELQAGDTFIQYETIDEVIPGSGPISITASVHDVNPGKWKVTAQISHAAATSRRAHESHSPAASIHIAAPLHVITRFWQWWAPSVSSTSEDFSPVQTRLSPFIRTPGMLPGAWITFVVIGFILALVTQFQVIAHNHLIIGPVGMVDFVAIIVGIGGAKMWYIAKHAHDQNKWIGWCIQGFTTGAAVSIAFLLVTNHMPIGTFFDITAPGMLAGMAVGRLGCFFAGCCGGPPTSSCMGVWSSDQRIGARRIPTQLMEAAFTMLLGIGALIVDLRHGSVGGVVFIAGMSAYTLGRQGILRLRTEQQQSNLRETLTTILAALIFLIAVTVIIIQVK